MRILKDLRIVLVVVMLLSWVAGGFLFWNYKTTNEIVIATKQEELSTLQYELEQIGELLPAFTVNADVPSGKKIEETDLEYIEVPTSMSTNLVTNIDEIIGKYYKVGLTAGTVITIDSVYEEVITDDLRYFDIVTHMNPIGLIPGNFVDIRIQMPMGEDYIAIPHRQVKAINGGILKLAITEQDIHVYNSMLVDSIIYPGTQIYGVEYIEGGVQKPAEAYYPTSSNIVSIAQKDPNMLTAIRQDIIQRRGILETGLTAAGVGLKDTEQADLSKVIETYRAKILQSMTTSQIALETERKAFELQQQQQGN